MKHEQNAIRCHCRVFVTCLGHNLGMNHDGNSGQLGGCPQQYLNGWGAVNMNPTFCQAYCPFSDCSVQELSREFNDNNLDCLKNAPAGIQVVTSSPPTTTGDNPPPPPPQCVSGPCCSSAGRFTAAGAARGCCNTLDSNHSSLTYGRISHHGRIIILPARPIYKVNNGGSF